MPNRWWPDTATFSEFVAPAQIVAGRGSAGSVSSILSHHLRLDGGTVLVAVDDIVLSNGLATELLAGLEAAGYEVVVYGGFGSEPSAEVIDGVAEQVRRSDVRAIIGIGGGSVLDSSKVLSVLMRNAGSAANWLGPIDPPNGVAPLVLIPTTCGTGSEATRIAMVTVDGAKRASSCVRFVPSAVVIDPDLVASLPGAVAASTAMDALAHAVESLMSTAHSPMSAHHGLRAIELLVSNVELAATGDADALGNCLWGSHLAGQALNAGVVVGHSLAYCLAYEHPMPHGVSCALALPYCIAYNSDLENELAEELAKGLTSGRSTDLRVAAREVLELTRRLGLPTTLIDVNITQRAEAAIAHRIVTEYPRPTNPVALVEANIGRLLAAMRTGDLDAAFDAAEKRAA